MSDLKDLSKYIETIRASNKNASFSKIDLLNLIDLNLTTIASLRDTMSKEVSAYITKKLTTPEFKKLATLHKAFVSQLSIKAKKTEDTGFLMSIVTILPELEKEHEKINVSFSTIFPGKENTMRIDEMYVTQVLTIGYLKSVASLLSFVSNIYALIPVNVSGNTQLPKYREVEAQKALTDVTSFINTVYDRSVGTTILAQIQEVKRLGTDVFVVSNGDTIDKYADDRDYSRPTHNFMGGFVLGNLSIFIGEAFSNIFRLLYAYRKDMREWMIVKTTLLKMDMENKDPDSEEYQHLVKILNKYESILAKYEQKISNYEKKYA